MGRKKAEYGGIFHNSRLAIPLRQALNDLNHPQPSTPICSRFKGSLQRAKGERESERGASEGRASEGASEVRARASIASIVKDNMI